MKIAYLVLLVSVGPIHGFFGYDRAIHASQKGDWEKAHQLLTDLVTHSPDNPQVLYDAGVAAFRLKQFAQAHAYFSRVAMHAAAPQGLKEQALFNLGNTLVEQKKLREAIDAYEKALMINPDNERTKHNLEVVKKMLEEQQQQEQDKQQEQEKNQQDDSDQHKEHQDQDNNAQNNDEPSDQDEHREQGQDHNKKQQGKQPDNTNGSPENQEGNQNKGQKNNESEGQSQEQDSQKQNQQKQQGANKDQVKQQQAGATGEEKQTDSQGQVGGQKPDKTMEAWLAQTLQESEQKDAQANKKIIRANVGNRLAGQDGQNCW